MINKYGFSILELTVVLIIMSILLSAVIPVLSRSYLEKAANKTALDIAAIQEASRKFYIDNNKWPYAGVYATPIAALQAGGYLPAAWSATNPFVKYEPDLGDFSYHISSNLSTLTVSTNVPIDAQPIIENSLPSPTVDPPGTGHNIYSTVSVPGALSALPSGALLAWPGTTAPAGFLMCDGSIYNTSSYSNLAAVLGSTFGGNGTTTFAVPDLRGRSIVGLNQISVNDGSNRIWWTDNYSDNKGQTVAYYVNQIGGILGEEKHRQSVVEMAPHTHAFSSWNYVKGFSGNSTTSPRDPQGGTTSSTGGNGDGSGLGAAANVVGPSMVMGYIIKY
jgi:prepilin-type N-terminal cleavage/methylation domain-containing protein